MRLLLPILIAAALAGCGQSTGVAVGPQVSREDRIKIDASRAREQPALITHKTAEGELVVLTVPTGGTTKRLDVQRCFVWRDGITKTTAMSCPSDQGDTVDALSSSWPGSSGYNP